MDYDVYIRAAMEVADEAFLACKPVPMVVGQAADLFSNKIIPGTEEIVEDGLCGFAWVRIKPARGPLIKYLKKIDFGNKSFSEPGWYISFYDICPKRSHSQSIARKEAACRAFVAKMQEFMPDLTIFMESRLD